MKKHKVGRAEQLRIRERVIERDGGLCVLCHASQCEAHHIISVRYAGAWDERNICLLCDNCHRHMNHGGGAHTHEARIELLGLMIELYGYDMSDMPELWQTFLREGGLR